MPDNEFTSKLVQGSANQYRELVAASEQKQSQLNRVTQNKQIALAEDEAKRNAALEKEVNERPRSAGEITSDILAGTARGGVALGEAGFAVADFLLSGASQGDKFDKQILQQAADQAGIDVRPQDTEFRLDDVIPEGSAQFNEIRKSINENLQSEPTKQAVKNIADAGKARNSNRNTRIEALIDEGYSKLGASAVEELGSFTEAVKQYADNPLAAIDLAVESIPQLVAGGVVGKGAAAGLTGKEATEAATRAAVGFTGLQEGGINANQVRTEVLGISHENLLKTSPMYKQLIDEEGLTPDQARKEVANRTADITGILAGTAGALTSKLTGAAGFEGSLFTPKSALGNVVTSTLKAAAKEGAEETIQSVTGQAATNIAKQQTVDPNQDILEGAGEQAAAGLVAGSLSGGAIATVTTGSETTAKLEQVVKDKAEDIKTTNEIAKAVESGDVTKFTNKEATDFDPEKAFIAKADPKFIPPDTDEQARTEYVGELAGYATSALNKAEAALEAKIGDKDADVTKELAAFKRAMTYVEQVEGLDSVNAPTPAQVNEGIKKITETKGTREETAQLLGSMDLASVDILQELSDTGSLTTEDKTLVDSHIRTRNLVTDVEKLTSSDVGNEIINGGRDNVGLRQYQKTIALTSKGNDQDAARDQLSSLANFAKRHTQKAQDIVNTYNAVTAAPKAPETLKLVQDTQDKYELKIHRNSNRTGLVDRVVKEAEALQAGFVESREVYSRAFKQASQKPSQSDISESSTIAPETVNTVSQEITDAPINQEIDTDTDTVQQVEADPEVTTKPKFTEKVKAQADDIVSLVRTNKDTADKTLRLDTLAQSITQSVRQQFPNASTGNVRTFMGRFRQGVEDAISGNVDESITLPIYKRGVALAEAEGVAKPYSLGNSITTPKKVNTFLNDKVTAKPSSKSNILHTNSNAFSKIDDLLEDTLSESDSLLLPKVKNFEKKFSATLTDVLSVKPVQYRGRDPIQYLLNDNDTFDPNVLSALAVTGLNWFTTRAKATRINDDAVINSILGKRSDSEVARDARNLLGRVGLVRSVLAETLGKEAINTLGIKVNKDVTGDVQAKLEMSIGNAIVTTLLENGLVTQNPVSNTAIAGLRGQSNESGKVTNFIRIKVDDEGKIPANIESVLNDFKGSKLLSEAFGTESLVTGPVLRKPTKVQTQVRNSSQKVSKQAQEIISKHQKRPYKIKTNVASVFDFLGTDGQLAAAGYKKDFESTVHVLERESIEAKNDAIEKEVQDFTDFTTTLSEAPKGMDTQFYFNHVVWSNARLGLESNTVNPQASKIHRHLLGAKEWDSKINPNDPAQMQQFYVAVAESLGVSVDKNRVPQTINEYSIAATNPVIQKGVDAIIAINSGDFTDANENQLRKDVLAAIKQGGENMFTLDGLVALADLKQADGKPFTTNMIREVDGITNGVVIGLLQLAPNSDPAILREQLARGGVFTDGQTESFGEWYSKTGNNDSYQDMALDWVNNLRALEASLEPGKANAKRALDSLIGSFLKEGSNDTVSKLGRNLSKNPLMVTNYGAAIKGTIQGFAEKIEVGIYNDIADAKDDPAALQKLSDSLLAITGRKPQLNSDNALEFILGAGEQKALHDLIKVTYGQALEQAIESKFGTFMKNRTTLNKALGIVFEAFNIKLEQELDKWKEANGGIEPTREVVDQIISDNQEFAPIFKHALSDGLSSGLLVMKSKTVRQIGEPAYRTEQTYTRKIRGTQTKSINSYGSKREFEDGGVAGAILGIHSIDAATMMSMLFEHDVLNVHDAYISSVGSTLNQAEDMNEAFYESNKNYSIFQEVFNTFERSLKAMQADDKKNGTNNIGKLVDRLNVKLGGQESSYDLPAFVNEFTDLTKDVVAAKEQVINSITSSVQYNTEGGQYTPKVKLENGKLVTDEKAIARKLAADFVKAVKDTPSTLGSSPTQVDPATFNGTKQDLDAASTEAVFIGLGKTGNKKDAVEHTDRLTNVLTSVINGVIKPFKYSVRQHGNITYGATDKSNVFVNIGMGSLANGLQMSAQEVFVHELVHNVTATGINSSSLASAELKRIFGIAEKHIKPSDFLNKDANGNVIDVNGNSITSTDPTYKAELDAAKERYDYIFNNTTADKNNRNTYLHEFMALGLTNANFNKALAKIDSKGRRTAIYVPGDFIGSLGRLFTFILDSITDRINKTSDLTTDKRLLILAQRLADQDSRNKGLLYRASPDISALVDRAIGTVTTHVATPLKVLGNALSKSKIKAVSSVGTIAKKIPTTSAAGYAKAITAVHDRMKLSKDSIITSLGRELRGASEDNNHWYDLLRYSSKMIDQTRVKVSNSVKDQLVNAFHGDLDQSQRNSITRVMLKTDIASLTDSYSWMRIKKFLDSATDLNGEIDTLTKQLNQFKGSNFYYRKMAASLGSYMATGVFTEDNSMMNAYNIANQFGTGKEPTGDVAKAEAIIDKLATLHALRLTNPKDKDSVSAIIGREFKVDPNENGIVFMGKLHTDFKKRSLDTSFKGQKALMIKGYTKEIFDPNVSIVYGELSDEKAMRIKGYELVGEVSRDQDDPSKDPVVMYKSGTDKLNTHLAGIVSLTSKRAKGTDLIDLSAQREVANPAVNAISDFKSVDRAKRKRVAKLFSRNSTAKSRIDNLMVPVVNYKGDITGYRYLMAEKTKQSVLGKNDDFGDVFGSMEAGILDKVNSLDVNSKVIKAAFDEYNKDYTKDPSKFTYIGKDASDPESRETYRLLPAEMREEMFKTFGKDGMYVKQGMSDMIFGYRKVSFVDTLLDTKRGNKANEFMLNKFNKSLKSGLRGFENVWQEIVADIKDIIVIKSGTVLAGNIMSNIVLLKTLGVSVTDIVKNHSVAIRSANEYQTAESELMQLERDLKADPNQTGARKKQVRVARLRDTLANSPVKDLIDAGVYQSIVEDVALLDDSFSYKGRVERFLSDRLPGNVRVPDKLKEVGKTAIIAQDTPLYRALRNVTQMSDFVARFVLHQHNLKNGMNQQDSIKDIVDTFINYDAPTHRWLQYGNDIGAILFTKYFVRVQKILYKLVTEKTANVLALIGFQQMFGDITDVMDSNVITGSVLDKFNTDPIEVLSGSQELATINLVTD